MSIDVHRKKILIYMLLNWLQKNFWQRELKTITNKKNINWFLYLFLTGNFVELGQIKQMAYAFRRGAKMLHNIRKELSCKNLNDHVEDILLWYSVIF